MGTFQAILLQQKENAMHMGMSISMSQALTMRQSLEARLMQSLQMKQEQRMEMKMYMEREDAFKKLYAAALGRGDLRQYCRHGLTFEFALVRRKELPPFPDLAENCGFAHCLSDPWDALFFGHRVALAQGSWLLFVVPDFFAPIVFPEAFIHYVAVHEHGEEVTLGQHHLASKLEFAVAQLEEQIRSYLYWLEKHYPAKFADVFFNQTRVVLPDSKEFTRLLALKSQTTYVQTVQRKIEGFEWPYHVLQRLNRYERRSRETEQLLLKACLVVVDAAEKLPLTLALPDAVKQLRSILRSRLLQVRPSSRYLCWPRVQEIYREQRAAMTAHFDRYRERRRQVILDRDGVELGTQAYLQEVVALDGFGRFPSDGILSLRLQDALASLDA